MIYDDVSVMKTSIETANSKLEEYSHFKNSMKDLLLETYIRAVLQNDTLTISRLLEEDITVFEQTLSRKMVIALFRVDNWKKNKRSLNRSVKECMLQISEKLFSTSDEGAHQYIKWIQRGIGEVYMIALNQDENVSEELWKERAVLVQAQFVQENKCPVSFVVGGFAEGAVQMKEIARETVLAFGDAAENKQSEEPIPMQEPKPQPDKHNAVVDAVREYINEHYSEEIVLKSLASNFNFSPGYLGAMFKESVGMSVLEYTNEVRLEAAAGMIRDTDLNMVDIMGKCGFINESNFYKLFKKKYEVTPRQYRMDYITAKK